MSAPFPRAWVGVTPSHPPHTGQWWGAWPFEEEAEDGEGLHGVRHCVLPEAAVLQKGQGQHRSLTGPHPAGTCPTPLPPHRLSWSPTAAPSMAYRPPFRESGWPEADQGLGQGT